MDSTRIQNRIDVGREASLMAPEEIPYWFTHKEPEKPRKPSPALYPKSDAPEHVALQKIADDWRRDACFDLVPLAMSEAEKMSPPGMKVHDSVESRLIHYEMDWEHYWDAKRAWEIEDRKERYFQWRIYYGLQMAERLVR